MWRCFPSCNSPFRRGEKKTKPKRKILSLDNNDPGTWKIVWPFWGPQIIPYRAQPLTEKASSVGSVSSRDWDFTMSLEYLKRQIFNGSFYRSELMPVVDIIVGEKITTRVNYWEAEKGSNIISILGARKKNASVSDSFREFLFQNCDTVSQCLICNEESVCFWNRLIVLTSRVKFSIYIF